MNHTHELRLKWLPYSMPGFHPDEVRGLISHGMWMYSQVCGLKIRWAYKNTSIDVLGRPNSRMHNKGAGAEYDKSPRTIITNLDNHAFVRSREGYAYTGLISFHEMGHALDHWKSRLFKERDHHSRQNSMMNYRWAFDYPSHTDIIDLQRIFGPPATGYTFFPWPLRYWSSKVVLYKKLKEQAKGNNNAEYKRTLKLEMNARRVWRLARDHYKGTPGARQPGEKHRRLTVQDTIVAQSAFTGCCGKEILFPYQGDTIFDV